MDDEDANNTKEEEDDSCEEIVRPIRVRSFLEHKKPKDKQARDHDYQRRYDDSYHVEYDYERHNNFDEGSRFNPKLDIPEFEGRMHADDFLD